MACGVGVARVNGCREAFERLGRPGAQQPVCLLQRDVLPVNRARRVLQPALALARGPELTDLRCPHQDERDEEHRERVEVHLLVGDRDDGSDEPVGKVMRQQPDEVLLPRAEHRLSLLDGDRKREQDRVDGEIRRSRRHSEGDCFDCRHVPGPEAEHRRGDEARGGQYTEVVERGVDRRPADDRVGEHRREGEHDRCAAADQGGARERADSADGDCPASACSANAWPPATSAASDNSATTSVGRSTYVTPMPSAVSTMPASET